jgi:hypothetical protein
MDYFRQGPETEKLKVQWSNERHVAFKTPEPLKKFWKKLPAMISWFFPQNLKDSRWHYWKP